MSDQFMPKVFHGPCKKSAPPNPSYILNVTDVQANVHLDVYKLKNSLLFFMRLIVIIWNYLPGRGKNVT